MVNVHVFDAAVQFESPEYWMSRVFPGTEMFNTSGMTAIGSPDWNPTVPWMLPLTTNVIVPVGNGFDESQLEIDASTSCPSWWNARSQVLDWIWLCTCPSCTLATFEFVQTEL